MASRLSRGAAALAMLVLLPYGAICALMYARQRDLTYYPQATRVPVADTDFALEREGLVLRGWHRNPGQPDALVYFGGNAESARGSAEQFAAWFPGRTVYALAYRGYGASEGEPTEEALAGDAIALYDLVASLHPGGDIAVAGRSLGSGVAAHVARARPVHRLVLVTPFDSLVGVAGEHYPWLPVGLLMKDRYDSALHLAGYRGPVLVLSAGRDRVVPPDSTARLVAALPVPPRIVHVEGADHDTALASESERDALRAFLAR